MPAKSKRQRRFFGIALAYKRGEITKSELNDDGYDKETVDDIIELSKLSEKTLKDFAATKQQGLPTKVKK